MPLDQDVIALYWTISGPVEVHVGREWSLFDLRDRCAHAARVGFSGIGIWHADLEHVLETRTLPEVRALFDEHGLRHLELEFLQDWFLDPSDPRRQEGDRIRALLWEAAPVLPTHHVKVGNIPGTPCEFDRLVEAYAELCADAASHHDAKVAFEFMPFDPNVPDLATALRLVEAADAPNGGLAIDTWHLAKLGIPADEVRRIPGHHIAWVELSDGHYAWLEDRVDEVVNHRELPGEGEFPIRDYVAALRDAGYHGPWGVEVLSEALRNLPIEEIFDRSFATSSAQLAAEERSLGV